MNLRKQVESLGKPRFRLPRSEACTPRGVAPHLGETLAQTSLPPSRAKQGTRTLKDLNGENGAAQGQTDGRETAEAVTRAADCQDVQGLRRWRRYAMRTRSSRRSSSPARSASSPSRVWLASRQRNSSSAMFSAASTARRSESPFGAVSAAARIFWSTYCARRPTYSGSSALRIG